MTSCLKLDYPDLLQVTVSSDYGGVRIEWKTNFIYISNSYISCYFHM